MNADKRRYTVMHADREARREMGAAMNADEKHPHSRLTEDIVGCAFEDDNTLGSGHSEKVREAALVLASMEHGHEAVRQVELPVQYSGKTVGKLFADICVDNQILVEVKEVRRILPEHSSQSLRYLKSAKYEVGLLLNFGSRVEIVRRIDTMKYRRMISTPQ